MTYDYQKPRGLNLVSIFMLAVLACGIYAAVKFVPVWWLGKKVDTQLDELKLQALSFQRANDATRRAAAESVTAQAIARIHDLGIEDQPDQPVEVWFTPDYDELHARYQIVVRHPGDLIHPTVMTVERTAVVPR
jgi:hypothetical protein